MKLNLHESGVSRGGVVEVNRWCGYISVLTCVNMRTTYYFLPTGVHECNVFIVICKLIALTLFISYTKLPYLSEEDQGLTPWFIGVDTMIPL